MHAHLVKRGETEKERERKTHQKKDSALRGVSFYGSRSHCALIDTNDFSIPTSHRYKSSSAKTTIRRGGRLAMLGISRLSLGG